MKRFFFLLLLVALMPVAALAQYDFLTAHRGVIKGGYDFWVYTPADYETTQDSTPVTKVKGTDYSVSYDIDVISTYKSR